MDGWDGLYNGKKDDMDGASTDGIDSREMDGMNATWKDGLNDGWFDRLMMTVWIVYRWTDGRNVSMLNGRIV